MNGSDPIPVKALAQSLNALCSVVYDLMWDYEDPVPQHQIDNIPHLVYGYAVDLGFLLPPEEPEDLDDPSLVELNAWLVSQKYYDNSFCRLSVNDSMPSAGRHTRRPSSKRCQRTKPFSRHPAKSSTIGGAAQGQHWRTWPIRQS